jgi:hypothetical protein
MQENRKNVQVFSAFGKNQRTKGGSLKAGKSSLKRVSVAFSELVTTEASTTLNLFFFEVGSFRISVEYSE